MKQYWLELHLDQDNVVNVTFASREDMQTAESYAKELSARRAGGSFYVQSRRDFAKILARCATLIEEES